MKFFIDSADVEEIKKAVELGMCDGVTTNPTLIMKAGREQEEVVKEIAKFVKGPISVEAISDDADGMVREGEQFAKWAPNVVIKVPMTKEGLKAVRLLAKKNIKCNVTLVFSAAQALLAAKAGAAFVSPFVGRLDDIGQNGMDLVRSIVNIYRNYEFSTEIIVASVRSVKHVEEAALAGAHIATIPPKVYQELWKHSLTDKGIELFKKDHAEYLKKIGKA